MSSELESALRDWPDDTPVAAFLLQNPQHRYMVRRAQIVARKPYAEIRDNLIAEDMLPIDMMRCKLAYFGASHFDPRSDRWVRICLFQNALSAGSDAGENVVMVEPNDPKHSGPPVPASDIALVQLSRNEIVALATKAARGAGMEWGLAEEAGAAAGWLAAMGLDGAKALLDHLQLALGKDWPQICPVVARGQWRSAGSEPLCPVALGATLCDFADLPDGLAKDDGLIAGEMAGLASVAQAPLRLGHAPDRAQWPDPAPPPPVSHQTMSMLTALAMKTTAPATDASREGAGAGTTDND